ncbi:MAG: glycosyltransferase family 4 protein [Propionibacteriaceae bacterium]|jgi:glycosyltransferase involved in cell wall biosynthesis|nr:glycosyltransferase family 4 protein [Propionibacteriaceae bacterium]
MKIGIVTQYYPPEPQLLPEQVATYLAKKGHRVRVLTGLPNYPAGRLCPGFGRSWSLRGFQNGIDVKRVPLFPSHSGNPVARILNYSSFALSALSGKAYLAGADVIYVYGAGIMVALAPHSWRKRVPYVLHIQDLWPESVMESGMVGGGPLLTWLEGALNAFCGRMYRGASAVLGISPSMTKTLIQRGADPETAKTVYNWGSEADVRPSRKQVAGSGNVLSLLYAGNLGQAQDLATVLKGLALLDDVSGVHLDIVGEGIEEVNLRKLANNLGLTNVEFHSRVSSEEVNRFYDRCDFHLVPLKDVPVFRMTIPSKFQAGLMRGVPVITSVQGDVAELVERNRVGIVVRGQDPVSWSEAVRSASSTLAKQHDAMARRSMDMYRRCMSVDRSLSRMEAALVLAASGRLPSRYEVVR